jgi:hypothetical protein
MEEEELRKKGVLVVMLTRVGRRNILGMTRKTSGRTGKSCYKDQGVPERRKRRGVRLAGTECSRAKNDQKRCKKRRAKAAFSLRSGLGQLRRARQTEGRGKG